ncbi:unnamed protein product [Arctia plantaginis]|uniref:Uncharacterized protein n=1 Tax=Arctia plantaginis TaxID=874455 RepID=A0A8S0ZXH7_ARCPL|nr:unnamed protein product [Arctia plantaginis]CAB3240112.1 unnamed protein product [Arctia plantaginis]
MVRRRVSALARDSLSVRPRTAGTATRDNHSPNSVQHHQRHNTDTFEDDVIQATVLKVDTEAKEVFDVQMSVYDAPIDAAFLSV